MNIEYGQSLAGGEIHLNKQYNEHPFIMGNVRIMDT